MNKKNKIIISALLLILGFFIDMNEQIKLNYYLILFVFIGFDAIKESIENMGKLNFLDENFLMTFASAAAFFLGEYNEAVEIMLFFNIGELFEHNALENSRKSINSLLDIMPEFANLETEKGIVKVDPCKIKENDVIVIKPGEKIPLDSIIIEGASSLNTSFITGESILKDVSVGDKIISGSINTNSVLKARVVKSLKDSTVSKIVELIENSSSKKANSEKFITKFAKYYTPVVIFLAFLTVFIPVVFLKMDFDTWLNRSLIFLVTSCPCALLISIPLGFFGGIGRASKYGILVKGGNSIEDIANLNKIFFDKTGTLTKGNFKVKEFNLNKDNEKEYLRLMAVSEMYSNHPIANAIKEYYVKTYMRENLKNEKNLDANTINKIISNFNVEEIEDIPGYGIKSKIDGKVIFVGNEKIVNKILSKKVDIPKVGTNVHLIVENDYKGYVVIKDEIREYAKEVVHNLEHKYKIDVTMLTGDNVYTAENISKELCVNDYKAELLPEEKSKIVKSAIEKNAKNKKIAFVGDGVNDAPSLMLSDVGISMGKMGQDIAIESSDIVIVDDDLRKINEIIEISKKTMLVVKENIVGTLLVKIAVMILGVMGIATIRVGVFADVGVSILAILNSSRLLIKDKKENIRKDISERARKIEPFNC